MNIIIREAKPNDALAIAKINIASWRTTYRGLIADATLDSMKEEDYLAKWDRILGSMETNSRFAFVAENDGEIIGYTSCGNNTHEKFPFDSELYAIYLLKEFQGKGIGKRLFLRVIDELKKRNTKSMLLFVLASNTPSRKFYESFKPDFTADETITIDNGQYCDLCFGWSDITVIAPQ